MTNRAEQFRNRTEEHALPSGAVVLLRRPDITALIMESETGDVPEAFTAQVLDSLKPKTGRKNGRKEGFEWQPEASDLPVISRFMTLIIRAAFVSPRIVDNPDYEADQIAMSDLTQADKQWVFGWAMPGMEMAAASRFPGATLESVEPARDGEELPAEAERPDGD